MPFSLHEVLTGGVAPGDAPLERQPLALDLELRGRGLLDALRGGPMWATGSFRAHGLDALFPEEGSVEGSVRLLVPHGLFYDLRLAGPGVALRDAVALRGARRFVRGDLWASCTTLEGVVHRGETRLGTVRLRFDARDDLPSLVRSWRATASR